MSNSLDNMQELGDFLAQKVKDELVSRYSLTLEFNVIPGHQMDEDYDVTLGARQNLRQILGEERFGEFIRYVEKKVPDLHHRSRRTAAWHGVFNDTTADRHFVSAVLKRGPAPYRQV